MTDFVPDFTVREGIWNDQVKVVEIKRKRHTVLLPNRDKPTAMSFCNNCGEGLILLPSNICACCEMPQDDPSPAL